MNQALDFFKSNIGKSSSEMSPSPFGRWLNGTLIEVEEGSLTAEFIVSTDMCNPGGIIHGGVATGIMDDLIGMTVFCLRKSSLLFDGKFERGFFICRQAK